MKRPAQPSAEHVRETVGFRRRRERRQQAELLLGPKPLIVGMDLAKRKHAVWLTGRDGVPIQRFMIAHSLEGIAALLERAERERERGGFERLVVFMEATSHFWRNVANAFEARGFVYRTVAPLAVDRQREITHLTFAKGDYRDAEIIARLGAEGHWLRKVLEDAEPWIELGALTREHEDLLHHEIAEKLRVRALLELVLPEFFDFFDDPFKRTALAVLRALGTAPLPRSVAEVVARAKTVEGSRLKLHKARHLVARLEAEPSYGVERSRPGALARVGLAVDRFDLLARQRKRVRERLVELYMATAFHTVLDTIPAVAPVNHALVLGLIGDPKRYDRGTCLAKFAGTEPRENHSGDAEGTHSISRRGVAHLRHVMFRIVSGLVRGNKEFAAYIERLRRREKNPLAWNQAVVAAGNKYLRLVRRLCVEGKAYDPKKLQH